MLGSCNNPFCALYLVSPADLHQVKYPYHDYSLLVVEIFHSFYLSYSGAPRGLYISVVCFAV